MVGKLGLRQSQHDSRLYITWRGLVPDKGHWPANKHSSASLRKMTLVSTLGEQNPHWQNEDAGLGSQSQCLQWPSRSVSVVGGVVAELPLLKGAVAS